MDRDGLVGLGWLIGWLVTYRNKCPARGIEPYTVAHPVLTGPDVD